MLERGLLETERARQGAAELPDRLWEFRTLIRAALHVRPAEIGELVERYPEVARLLVHGQSRCPGANGASFRSPTASTASRPWGTAFLFPASKVPTPPHGIPQFRVQGNWVLLKDYHEDPEHVPPPSVTTGGLVGIQGESGNADGPHLHFKVEVAGGTAVCPYHLGLIEGPLFLHPQQ